MSPNRFLLISTSLCAVFMAAACSGGEDGGGDAAPAETAAPQETVAETPGVLLSRDALSDMRAQFAVVEMQPDVSFLSEEERGVVNLLNRAGALMSEIYLRQRSEENPALKAGLQTASFENSELILDLFNLHFGPWDTLNDNKPFYGATDMPLGAAFYPDDITREEFDAWIAAHPEDEDAFKSGYTVIRREGDGLVAIPYSVHYQEWLEPAAELLREAAALTTNASLKKFLTLRAESFLSDDYFDSELAWMDLDGPIEVAIGPYEVYTDLLFGYKTAFEAFITVKNPDESAALAKYKDFLRDMEANLPVDERYKNFKRGFASPIVAAYQVHGGGDNVPGVQTIAFNLPNDERVREAKGAKKVILNNVLGAKFDRILAPMAEKILVPDQVGLLDKKYMANGTLFHELAHSLGPGSISVETPDGAVRATTVGAELKELYSPLEEGKADVMGAYNILFMMERGELPASEKESFLATYFAGLFRSMRFGIAAAHGRGAAFQYTYFKEAGAFTVEGGQFRLDFATLEQAIRDLTRDVVIVQGDGDYDAAKAFLEKYGKTDADVDAAIARLIAIPVDIQPVYRDEI